MNYIRVELLSDTCFSSGEVYNSAVDTDVFCDANGIPVIGGKRLKGCIREAAEELRDWGYMIDVEGIFGARYDRNSAINISDAKPEQYDQYISELSVRNDPMLVYPSRVLDAFTYIRTQTALDQEGIADRNTLRSTRVIKKGLVFFAPVEFRCSDEKKHEYEDQMVKICKAVRHMGLNRTRGMGSVKVNFEMDMPELFMDRKLEFSTTECQDSISYSRLDYRLYLHSAVLCKSAAGGQTVCCPYIEGAKILGMIAEAYKMEDKGNEKFAELTKDQSLICSNAYISDGKKRFEPADASLFVVKDNPCHGRCKAVDIGELRDDEIEKLSPLGDKFICYNGQQAEEKKVDMEIRYHHSRPADKSIGHVVSSDSDNQMYQIESISAGQTFAGYILGSSDQIRKICKLFKGRDYYRIGYNRSAEYGEVSIHVVGLSENNETEEGGESADTFLLRLNSPAILRRENGMVSPDEEMILDQLKKKLDLPDLEIEKRFLKFTEIGGYNVTWNARKPSVPVFDKGTAFVMRSPVPVCLEKINRIWIGERNMEGYGEIRAEKIPEQYKFEIIKAKEEKAKKVNESESVSDMLIWLGRRYAEEIVQAYAVKQAERIWESIRKRPNANAVVNQMLMILKEQKKYSEFKRAVEDRYDKGVDAKQEKLETAKKIYTFPEQKIMEMFPSDLPVKIGEDEVYMWYFSTLLTQLKYKIRHQRKGGKEKNEQ